MSDVPRSLQLCKLSFNHSHGRTHSWRFSTFYKIRSKPTVRVRIPGWKIWRACFGTWMLMPATITDWSTPHVDASFGCALSHTCKRYSVHTSPLSPKLAIQIAILLHLGELDNPGLPSSTFVSFRPFNIALFEPITRNDKTKRYRTPLWLVHNLISNIVPKKMGVPLVWRLKLAHYVPKIGKSNKMRCLATIWPLRWCQPQYAIFLLPLFIVPQIYTITYAWHYIRERYV